MLHLKLQPESDSQRQPYAEAVSRLAGIRHALRLVDDWGGGPAGDSSDALVDGQLAADFAAAGDARQRRFDHETARTVSATAAGLEAILGEQQAQRRPHVEASRFLVDEIRRELSEVSRIVLR